MSQSCGSISIFSWALHHIHWDPLAIWHLPALPHFVNLEHVCLAGMHMLLDCDTWRNLGHRRLNFLWSTTSSRTGPTDTWHMPAILHFLFLENLHKAGMRPPLIFQRSTTYICDSQKWTHYMIRPMILLEICTCSNNFAKVLTGSDILQSLRRIWKLNVTKCYMEWRHLPALLKPWAFSSCRHAPTIDLPEINSRPK